MLVCLTCITVQVVFISSHYYIIVEIILFVTIQIEHTVWRIRPVHNVPLLTHNHTFPQKDISGVLPLPCLVRNRVMDVKDSGCLNYLGIWVLLTVSILVIYYIRH